MSARLGTRPAGPAEGDLALERSIVAADAGADAALVPLLLRRLERQLRLLDPVLREFRGVRIQSLA